MGLYFHNKTSSTVWVVYAYHSPGCEGGVNWTKKGWYKVSPAKTAKVWSGWAGGNKFFFYAEDNSGHSWAGQFFTFVPPSAFSWCWNTASTNGKTVGFRKIHASNMDYTINLIL
jgi:hypothetical protein